MVEKRRLLILGGAGYIGARLAQALSDEYEVWVTYRNLSPLRERWLKENREIRAARFDAALDEELPFSHPFHAVMNLAMPGADESQKTPEECQAQGMRIAKILRCMAGRGLFQRLIHFSTFRVYGPQEPREFYIETDEAQPQHPYALNHLVCERELQDIGCEALFIVRPTNIVAAPSHGDLGPQSRLVFLSLCRQAAETGSMRLDNDGLSYRDFIGFADTLAAVRLLLSCEAAPATVLNLSAASACRLDAFAGQIQRVATEKTGARLEVAFGTGKDAWRGPFVVSNQRLRSLGWNPQLDLSGEIGKTLEFFAKTS